MKDKKSRFLLLPLVRALALLSLTPECFAGQNFLIAPNGALPSTVNPGSYTTANFTVTNLTHSTRSGYVIRGLPSTVAPGYGSGNCTNPITLTAGASCNLELIISGAAQGKFAICKGNSCTTSSTPLNVSVSLGLMVAGGTYCNTSTCYPLLAQSNTGAWTYPSTILSNLPVTSPAFITPDFYSVSCSGGLCIAVGEDSNNGANAFIAMTTDGGITWTYPVGGTSNPPPNIYSSNVGGFNAASCSGNLCIAAGVYAGPPNGDFFNPMVAQYSGGVWSYVIDNTTPPNYLADFSEMNGASCSGNLCVAVGGYEDANNGGGEYPLIAQTTDGGSTWGYSIQDGTGPTFTNLIDSVFQSASCVGNVCVAVGSFEDTSDIEYPLIVTTNDGGALWNITMSAGVGPVPANFVTTGEFDSVSCTATLCIAGGDYIGAGSTVYPMLAQSTDGGNTWTFSIDSSTGLPANYGNDGEFYATSCSGNTCIAAGSYIDTGGNLQAFLVQTTDGGVSWTTIIDDSTALQPPGYTSGAEFYTASCNANACLAAGTYTSGAVQYPLLAQSIMGGPWTFAIDNNVATLPPGFAGNGEFDGSSIGSNASLLPKKHKKHYLKKHHDASTLKKGKTIK